METINMELDTSITIKTGADLFSRYRFSTVKSRNTEYGDMLNKFLDKLNPDRVSNNFSPLAIGRLAGELKRAKYATSQLYAFYQECERAKNFSSYFWFRIKERKNKQPKLL